MCHVCGVICYLCVELKLMINTRSLSNQALKSAHPSLLCCPLLALRVFIGASQPLQHGEVRDTNLAWVRPVTLATSTAWCRCLTRLHTHSTTQGLYSLSGKSYRQISWSLETARLDVTMVVSLWNLTGTSAAALPRYLPNFRAIGKV